MTPALINETPFGASSLTALANVACAVTSPFASMLGREMKTIVMLLLICAAYSSEVIMTSNWIPSEKLKETVGALKGTAFYPNAVGTRLIGDVIEYQVEYRELANKYEKVSCEIDIADNKAEEMTVLYEQNGYKKLWQCHRPDPNKPGRYILMAAWGKPVISGNKF